MLIVPLLAALAGSSHAAGPSDVRLHYITPDAAYDAVKNTPGLDSVTLALKGGVILLQGTEDGIGEAKSRLALIDVPQTELSIVATLVQFERQPDGSVRERTMLKPLLTTLDNVAAFIGPGAETGDTSVKITPRLNRDGTVTLDAEFKQLSPRGGVVRSARVERRVRPETPTRIAGLTTSSDMLVRHAVEAGETVADRGPYDAVYLDVKVQRVSQKDGK
jgi:hypothetical protein